MKISKILKMGMTACALTLTIGSFAMAKDSSDVAVIDIQQLVENSPQINALKTEQKNKLTELGSFVEKARAEVAKETDSAKKKALEEKYNKELNSRKEVIDKEFIKKMSKIDKDIKDTIQTKSADYDLVLVKGVVLKGGVDITSEIIKSLK